MCACVYVCVTVEQCRALCVCGALVSLHVSVCVTECPQRWNCCVCWWERWRLLSMSHSIRWHLHLCVYVCVCVCVSEGWGRGKLSPPTMAHSLTLQPKSSLCQQKRSANTHSAVLQKNNVNAQMGAGSDKLANEMYSHDNCSLCVCVCMSVRVCVFPSRKGFLLLVQSDRQHAKQRRAGTGRETAEILQSAKS